MAYLRCSELSEIGNDLASFVIFNGIYLMLVDILVYLAYKYFVSK